MTVHVTIRSRLAWGIGAGIPAAVYLAFLVYAFRSEFVGHAFLAIVPALFPVFVMGGAAYYYGRDSTLTLDEGIVVFRRPIGRRLKIAASDIRKIGRVPGRYTASIKLFRKHHGKPIMIDAKFARSDLEAFAKQAGIAFHWDPRWDQ